MRKRLFTLLFLLLATSLFPLWGQELQSIYHSLQRPMTYQEVLERSVFFDSPVGRMRVDSLFTQLNYNEARAAWLPRLEAELRQDLEIGRSEDETNLSRPRSSANTYFDIRLDYPLFSGLERTPRIAEERYQLGRIKAEGSRLREMAEVRGMQLFYNYLMLLQIHQALQEQLQDLKQEEANLKTHIVGASKAETQLRDNELRAYIHQLEGRLQDVWAECEAARIDLSVCVEYYGEAPLQLVAPNMEQLVQTCTAYLQEPQEIYRKAFALRPDMQAANLGIAAAQAGIRAAQSGYIPKLSLQTVYSNAFFNVLQQTNAPFANQIQNNGRFFFGFSLKLPIFDALQTPIAVKRAEAKLCSAQLDSIDYELGLYKEIHKAHSVAKAAYAKLQAAHKTLGYTQQSREAVRQKYYTLESNSYDIMDAEDLWQTVYQQYIQAQYNFVFKASLLHLYARDPQGAPIR